MKHCEACSFEEELAAVLRAVTSEEVPHVQTGCAKGICKRDDLNPKELEPWQKNSTFHVDPIVLWDQCLGPLGPWFGGLLSHVFSIFLCFPVSTVCKPWISLWKHCKLLCKLVDFSGQAAEVEHRLCFV
jgi:hypothetical protein